MVAALDFGVAYPAAYRKSSVRGRIGRC